MEANTCKCPHHKVVPVVLMLIGLSFLLQMLSVLPAMVVGYVWPIGLMIIGAVKLGGCKCCSR